MSLFSGACELSFLPTAPLSSALLLLFKSIYYVIIIVSGTDLTTNFIDMRAPHQNSPEHLAFLLELSIIHSLHGVIHIGIPLFVFNIWWLLCSLSVQHGCLLFFQFTLASGVLLVQEFSVSIIARFLHVGKTFAKNLQVQKYCTSMVD